MASSKDTTLYSKVKDKLASSGLTLEDAKILGMDALSAQQTVAAHSSFQSLMSLKINYFDPFGGPMSDWPKAPPFYRIRYLEKPIDFNTAAGGKTIRYVQEPYTAPVAYYPRNQNWADILKDPLEPLIITEGELKAAKACKEGFPAIGLGGVYNWHSSKLGITWLKSLDFPIWLRRHVYVVFDSDYRTNPGVCTALRDLAEAYQERGAYSHIVSLPQLPELAKTGLDDFLTFAGPTAKAQFRQLLAEAEPLGLTAPLWELNESHIYVQNPGLVINSKTCFKISPNAFRDHNQATLSYQERILKGDGSVAIKPSSASAYWLKWPLRAEVEKLTYEPGKPKRLYNPDRFNLWTGWGVEPKEGDITPFMDLVDHIFSGAEPAAKEWFLNWCAYPLQYPGSKMFSSVVIHGIRHGTGKSLLGQTIGRIYGSNFTEISQIDLHGSFNDWAEGKQFIMGDDVAGSDKRVLADFLKKMITQKSIRINAKYVPAYEVPDCINYFFTANHPDAFYLEDDDRRFFILEVIASILEESFYMDYGLWLDSKKDGGGAAALYYYFLNRDLGDFNPNAPAFRTMAKERMIANTRSDLASWVRLLLATPEAVLKVGEISVTRDMLTSAELLQFYDPIGKTGTMANGMGRELSRAGVQLALDGKPVRTNDGKQSRFYIIRNTPKWLKAEYNEVAAYINNWYAKQSFEKPAKY
jgi:hypothetical protein